MVSWSRRWFLSRDFTPDSVGFGEGFVGFIDFFFLRGARVGHFSDFAVFSRVRLPVCNSEGPDWISGCKNSPEILDFFFWEFRSFNRIG